MYFFVSNLTLAKKKNISDQIFHCLIKTIAPPPEKMSFKLDCFVQTIFLIKTKFETFCMTELLAMNII